MASNLAKAVTRKEIYCTINSTKHEWRDFTLQKGHIYGYSPELERNGLNGMFVLYQVMYDYLVVYCSHNANGGDRYIWKPYMIDDDTMTALRILEVSRKRRGGVVIDESAKYDFVSHYNPRLVTAPFMPMPHMRIPMGRRETVIAESHERVSNDLTSAKSSAEWKEKRRKRKVDLTLKRIENSRAHHDTLQAIKANANA